MRLLFDLGNSQLKWARDSAGNLTHHGKVASRDLTETDLNSALGVNEPPDSIWLSSVAPGPAEAVVESWAQGKFGQAVNRATVTEHACGVKNRYADLSQLGIDRWLVALGSRKFCSDSHVVVVDAGTAITIDVLTADNVFLGGAIVPGALLMHDSLIRRTAGIASEFVGDARLIGNHTQECVNSGVHYGMVGAVDGIVSRMCSELLNRQQNFTVDKFITGGDAKLIMQNSAIEYRHVGDLVLKGLASIADQGS